jgi:hypothetical protein
VIRTHGASKSESPALDDVTETGHPSSSYYSPLTPSPPSHLPTYTEIQSPKPLTSTGNEIKIRVIAIAFSNYELVSRYMVKMENRRVSVKRDGLGHPLLTL